MRRSGQTSGGESKLTSEALPRRPTAITLVVYHAVFYMPCSLCARLPGAVQNEDGTFFMCVSCLLKVKRA